MLEVCLFSSYIIITLICFMNLSELLKQLQQQQQNILKDNDWWYTSGIFNTEVNNDKNYMLHFKPSL